jgi:predicted RNase H-like HicB family nuclease
LSDGYLARIPGIQGAFAEGDTLEDAMFNCVDVFKMIIDYKKEEDKPIWKL